MFDLSRKTVMIKIDSDMPEETYRERLSFAAEAIKNGGLVAFPTETVYGLGANALDSAAVARIFSAKGRQRDNPLILHVPDVSHIEKYCDTANPYLEKLSRFMPGPLTVILPKKDIIPDLVTAGLQNVAIRVPDNPIARNLLEYAGVPIAAPSANRSGTPSPTRASHVMDDLSGEVDVILDGGECPVGLESTVLTLCTDPPTILRPGGVTREQIRESIGDVLLSEAVSTELGGGEKAASPGVKYTHYAPKTPLFLVSGDDWSVRCLLKKKQKIKECAILCFFEDVPFLENRNLLPIGKKDSPEQFARALFSALRETDSMPGIKAVYARVPADKRGISLALHNRLQKASSFHTIHADLCAPGMLIVGLTGPSGAGKGLFCSFAEKFGFPCIDTDAVARKVVEKKGDALAELTRAFGTQILLPDGSLDREKLAAAVFTDGKKLKLLNQITHKYIEREVYLSLAEHEKRGVAAVVIDAPVLFESDIAFVCDITVAVVAGKQRRLERIIKRDAISKERALRRLSAARSDGFFYRHADYILSNDADPAAFADKSKKMLREVQDISRELKQ